MNDNNPIQTGFVDISEDNIFRDFIIDETLELIDNKEPVTVLGAKYENIACGALAGYFDEDYFLITSIYVAPDYRLLGVGSALVSRLIGLIPDETPVKVEFPITEDDTPAGFFNELDFIPVEPDDSIFVTSVASLKDVELLKAKYHFKGNVLPFSECTKQQLKAAMAGALEENAPMPEEGLFAPDIDKQLSYLYMDGDELISLLIIENIDNASYIAGIYSVRSKPIACILQTAIKRMLSLYPEDHLLYIPVTNRISRSMVRSIIPEAPPVIATYIRL